MRNLFLAGPLPEATGVSGAEPEEDEVRFRGAAASEVRGEVLRLGGSAGSTTTAVVVVCGGVGDAPRGHERSSGCIWQSAFILALS